MLSPLQGLIEALEALLEQASAYERAMPPGDSNARAAIAALGDLGRRAWNEAQALAETLEGKPGGACPLSPRELQVLSLAVHGLTNKEIAYRLNISERTVQFHMNSVFNKTGASSRTEAAAIALGRCWVDFTDS